MKLTQNPKTKLVTVTKDNGEQIKLYGLLHCTSTKAVLLDETAPYMQDMLSQALISQCPKLISDLVFLDAYQLAAVSASTDRLEEQRPVSQEMRRELWRENKNKIRKTKAKNQNEVPENGEA